VFFYGSQPPDQLVAPEHDRNARPKPTSIYHTTTTHGSTAYGSITVAALAEGQTRTRGHSAQQWLRRCVKSSKYLEWPS